MLDPYLFISSFYDTEIVLALIIIFAFVFAVLTNVKIFSRNIKFAIAFAVALMAITGHYYHVTNSCMDFINVMHDSGTTFGILIIAFLGILVILGVLGMNADYIFKVAGFICVVILISVITLFYFSNKTDCNLFNVDYKVLFQPVPLVIIGVLVIIYWFITMTKDNSKKKGSRGSYPSMYE